MIPVLKVFHPVACGDIAADIVWSEHSVVVAASQRTKCQQVHHWRHYFLFVSFGQQHIAIKSEYEPPSP